LKYIISAYDRNYGLDFFHVIISIGFTIKLLPGAFGAYKLKNYNLFP